MTLRAIILDEYIGTALRAGASGFLVKDATPEELVQAVRVVAAGNALLAPAVTRRLLNPPNRVHLVIHAYETGLVQPGTRMADPGAQRA